MYLFLLYVPGPEHLAENFEVEAVESDTDDSHGITFILWGLGL